jgi:hypothetical protein
VHGDIFDAHFAKCGCEPCTISRDFQAFCDSSDLPERPAAITNRREAAQFFRWLSLEIMLLVEDT